MESIRRASVQAITAGAFLLLGLCWPQSANTVLPVVSSRLEALEMPPSESKGLDRTLNCTTIFRQLENICAKIDHLDHLVASHTEKLGQILDSLANLLPSPHSDLKFKLIIEVLAFSISALCVGWLRSCCRKSENKELKDLLMSLNLRLAHLNSLQQNTEIIVKNSNLAGLKIIYEFSAECIVLQAEILQCLREALRDSGIPLEERSNCVPQERVLLLYFDIVDDRIRNVEQKTREAAVLLEQTKNNCVWAFFCYKPTAETEGTKIQNSISGFPSGYSTKEGKFHRMYLTFDYRVKSNEKDSRGNFSHFLADKGDFVSKITDLIRQQ